MLARMDVITLHCPHTPATFHLLSARRLKLMKPSAVVVNTSRGEVIDENALTRGLRAGELAGAGLDVFENEPAVHPALLELPNVVLLPHIGSASYLTRDKMAQMAAENLIAGLKGERLPNCVNPEVYA